MSEDQVRSPVLIAGAGPIGMAVALLLGRWGVPSVLLEAQPAHDPTGSKAICVQRDVLDIFDRLGCAAPMVSRGVTWRRGRTFYRDRELFQITFPETGRSAFPPFVNIGQGEVERFMWDLVEAQPLITVRRAHRLTAIRQDEHGVTATLDTPDGPAHAAADYLVGADGARSTVRTLLGLPFDGESFGDQFLIADIQARLPYEAERRFFFDPEWNPGRQVLLHPQPDSVWRIDWQVPHQVDLRAEIMSGGLDARVRTVIGGRTYRLVWVSAYRFHQRLAPRMRVGRVLLAGDAAHVMSPFGARGMNSGMQDAENLAWKLAFVLAGWATPALLETYQSERTGAARENLRVTGATMRFLVPRDEQERHRRTALLDRAAADPAACALVDSGRLAEPFWYLDSPLTTPLMGAAATGVFPTEPGLARPPVPGVLCPDGPCAAPGMAGRRLRALFGDAITVLLADAPTGHHMADGTSAKRRGADETSVGRMDELAAAARAATRAPVRVHRLAEIDVERVLGPALRACVGTAYVIRPDGHLAAVLPAATPTSLAAAVARSTGFA